MSNDQHIPESPVQWYYSKQGSQYGPIDEIELRRLAQTGDLLPSDLVWNEFLGEQWLEASGIEGLFASPPPLSPITSLAQERGNTPNRDLMKLARESLKNQWALAVLATLLYFVILETPAIVRFIALPKPHLASLFHGFPHATPHSTIVTPQGLHTPGSSLLLSIISLICSLLQILLSGPLAVGFCLFFLNLSRNSGATFRDLFVGFRSGFGYFWKTIGACLLVGLIILGWILLFLLPGAALWIWAQLPPSANSPMLTVFLILLSRLLVIAGVIMTIINVLRYAMTFFVIADQPSIRVLEAIRKSRQMMEGKKWKYVCLQFRFIGWNLLALLTCGIGFLWIFAYIMTAKAHFYSDVKGLAKLPDAPEAKNCASIS